MLELLALNKFVLCECTLVECQVHKKTTPSKTVKSKVLEIFSDLGYYTNNHTLIQLAVSSVVTTLTHTMFTAFIHRFISCGTIEEKIYRRQVFKHSVNLQTMQKDDKNLFRLVLTYYYA